MKKLSLNINRKLLTLLRSYVQFQKDNGYPNSSQIRVLINNNTVNYDIFKLTYQPVGDPTIPSVFNYDGDSQVYKTIGDYTVSRDFTYYRSRGLFECAGEKLNTFHTSSDTTFSNFYLRVLDKPENENESSYQFDITYGHVSGSGSKTVIDKWTTQYPAKIIYKNYLMEYFDKIGGKIPFKNGKNGDYFYAVNFNTKLFPEMIDPGNIQITLSPISSSDNQLFNTGSNFYPDNSSSVMYTLIDDSGDQTDIKTLNRDLREYYYLVSGSLTDGIHGENTDDAWGIVFPKKGIIIFDGVVLDQSCSLNTVTASINGDNIPKFFASISASCNTTLNRSVTGSWYARSSEEIRTQTYFCKANISEFNHSNNYTYISGSYNELKHSHFIDNPRVYISAIGLYDEQFNLIAVGKLPKPILKDSNKELIFQVRLRLN
jgi:hypothetical protein